MGFVSNRSEFNTYYKYCNNLFGSPVNVIPGSQIDLSEQIRDTFKALADYENNLAADDYVRFGRSIVRRVRIDNLTDKDLKLFASFATKYIKKSSVQFAEKDAGSIIDSINSIQNANFQKVKQTLLLYKKLDDWETNQSEDPLAIDARNRLTGLLKVEQKRAITREEEIKDLARKQKIVAIAGAIFMGVIGAVAVGASMAAIPFLGPIPLLWVFPGALAIASGVLFLWRGRLKPSVTEDFSASLKKMETLEEYKKLTKDPNFVSFMKDPNNPFNPSLNDKEFLMLFKSYTPLKQGA